MKKPFLLIIPLLLVLSSFILIFILTPHTIKKVIYIDSSERIVYDYLLTNKYKLKWWPIQTVETYTSDSTKFLFHKQIFEFHATGFNAATVILSNSSEGIITSKLLPKNIVEIVWEQYVQKTLNPIRMISTLMNAKKSQHEIDTLLNKFARFAIKPKNIYTYDIQRSTVKDTILITTQRTLSSPPDPKLASTLLASLQQYIKEKNAKPTNYPMLNITNTGYQTYVITVAIPIDKYIPPKDKMLVNRMIPGNILYANVTGGHQAIQLAFDQLKNYMKDFKLTSPAIPFELMITDRNLNPDSSKWQTKVYYPIF